MDRHRLYNDEMPVVWIAIIILCAFWISSCAEAPERKPTPAEIRAMAYDWAYNGMPAPPAPYYEPYYATPPRPGIFDNALTPRRSMNCMQYGQLGQSGQFNCW